MDEPGDAPRQPRRYLDGRDPKLPLDPIADTAEGLPTVALVSAEVPQQWTYVGGISTEGEEDTFVQLAKHLKQGLPMGLTVNTADASYTVTDLPAEAFRHGGVDITKANNHTYFSENWLSTTIKVTPDQVGWYRFITGYDAGVNYGANWLAGISVNDGDVFQLQAGQYPLVMQTRIAQTNPWGMIQVKPRLIKISQAEVEDSLAFIALTEELKQEQYQQMLSYHQDNNGASADAWLNFALARH